MKAKSRRRLLISSVAMLLVAMLALGTATFAWFTVDNRTTAQGINVKTSKQSNIVVSSVNSQWTNDLNYNVSGRTMAPASSTTGAAWFWTEAADGEHYNAKAAADAAKMGQLNTAAALIADTGHVFYNMLNVKNVGSAATTKAVHITATLNETEAVANSGKDYLRLALVESSCTSDAGRSSAVVKDANTFKSGIYSVDSSDSWKPVSAINTTTGAITENGTAYTSNGASIDVNVGILQPDTPKYYMLIIWFEGQDPDCFDTYSGNELPSISFSIAEET